MPNNNNGDNRAEQKAVNGALVSARAARAVADAAAAAVKTAEDAAELTRQGAADAAEAADAAMAAAESRKPAEADKLMLAAEDAAAIPLQYGAALSMPSAADIFAAPVIDRIKNEIARDGIPNAFMDIASAIVAKNPSGVVAAVFNVIKQRGALQHFMVVRTAADGDDIPGELPYVLLARDATTKHYAPAIVKSTPDALKKYLTRYGALEFNADISKNRPQYSFGGCGGNALSAAEIAAYKNSCTAMEMVYMRELMESGETGPAAMKKMEDGVAAFKSCHPDTNKTAGDIKAHKRIMEHAGINKPLLISGLTDISAAAEKAESMIAELNAGGYFCRLWTAVDADNAKRAADTGAAAADNGAAAAADNGAAAAADNGAAAAADNGAAAAADNGGGDGAGGVGIAG